MKPHLRPLLNGVLIVLAACGVWELTPSRSKSGAVEPSQSAQRVSAPFDLGAVVEQVRFAYRPEGAAWTAGHETWAARVEGGGLEFTPRQVLGSRGPGAADEPGPATVASGTPVRFAAPEVQRGARRVTGPVSVHLGARGQLLLGEGALVESLSNSRHGVEQAWRFSELPEGTGALEVRVPVHGGRYVGTTQTGLHFQAGELMVRYGHGTWVDAAGQRTAVPARFEAGAIVLRVPVEVLASSTFPAELDPVIGPEFGMDAPVEGPAGNAQQAPALASDGTGFLLVWQDARSLASNFDIYGARLSAAGAVLDPSGIAISTAANSQTSPAVSWDGANYVVVWSDARNSTTNLDLYGARVSPSGLVLDPGGLAISTRATDQRSPAVSSGGGTSLIVWRDSSTSGVPTHRLYSARLAPSGAVQDDGGVQLSTATATGQYSPAVAWAGTHYLVVWSDLRSSTNHTDVYGAKVNAAGVIISPPEFPIAASTDYQDTPAVAWDGTNALVVWASAPDDGGVPSFNLVGTRVNASGAVLDSPAMAISSAVNDQRNPSLAWTGTQYLVVWEDFRSSTVGSDVYSARVTPAGAVMDPSGLPIATGVADQGQPVVAWSGSTPLVAWADDVDGGPTRADIRGTRITAAGAVQDPAGLTLSTVVNSQTGPQVAWDGTNYLVVWADLRAGAGNPDIYGTRVGPAGTILDVSGISISTASGVQSAPALAWSGTSYLVVWEDFRAPVAQVYGSRVSAGGVVLDPAGVAISASSAGQALAPAVASDGTTSLVVWSDDRNAGVSDLYGARVSAAGVVLDSSGIAISTAANLQTDPDLTWAGDHYLVVWRDLRSAATGDDIYAARVSPGGVVLDAAGIAVSTAPAAQLFPALDFNGADALVVWQDHRGGGNADVFGARVTRDGGVLDLTGLPIASFAYDQRRPDVSWDGPNYLVVWQDLRGAGGAGEVYGARVGANGVLRDPLGVVLASKSTGDLFPAIVSRGRHEALVVSYGADAAPAWPTYRVTGRTVHFGDAPLAAAASVPAVEDTPKAIALSGSDVDGDPLTFAIATPPVHGALQAGDGGVTYTPVADYAGPDTFTFTVNDGYGDSPPATITLDVVPVSDPPHLDVIASQTVVEDSAATQFVVTGLGPGGGVDEATQTVAVTAVSSAPNIVPSPTVTGSGSTRTLTFTPVPNESGDLTLTVTAKDDGSTAGGGADALTQVVPLKVLPVNDAPVFDPIVAQTTTREFTSFLVSVTQVGPGGGTDELGQSVTLTATSSDPSRLADPVVTGTGPVRTLTFSPVAKQARGSFTVTVTAKDSGGTANGAVDALSRSFTLEVTGENKAPLAVGGGTTSNGSPVTFTLAYTDPDGDPLTLVFGKALEHGALSGTAPELTYTPEGGFSGTDSFSFKVDDGLAQSEEVTFTIEVTPGAGRAQSRYQWSCGSAGGGFPMGLSFAALAAALRGYRRRRSLPNGGAAQGA